MRVKFQFQQKAKMRESNFFDLCFGNSDSDCKFEGVMMIEL